MLDAAHAKNLELQDLVTKFLKSQENIKSASLHTLKAYSLDLTQAFFRHLDHEKMSNPAQTKYIAEEELVSLSRAAQGHWGNLSAATRNRKAATLKSFLSYLFDERLITQDLSLQIHCPKIPRKIPHFLSVDDILAVLQSYQTDEKAISSNTSPEHQHLLTEKILFLLLYGGGLRISEACNLKWNQCQLDQQVIRILGKGNKERLVALPKTLCLYLLEFKKHSQVNNSLAYIWGTAALSPRVGYEWIRQRGRRAKLMHPIHPHALRHSFATHLLSSGANLRTLQELLGHESLRATEKYTHLDIHQLARTMEKHHPLSSANTDKREKSEG